MTRDDTAEDPALQQDDFQTTDSVVMSSQPDSVDDSQTTFFAGASRLGFKGICRPSKIPRLTQQSSGGSITGDYPFRIGSQSGPVSVTSGMSSRDTTPFNSPMRPSRLREPKRIPSRKRPREELSTMMDTVTERLQYSQDMSVVSCSQTTQDDTSSVSSRLKTQDDEAESVYDTRSVVSLHDEGDEQQRVDQEIAVAKALRKDLLRDRARLNLKISNMKDDIDFYYELLVRIERVVVVNKERVGKSDRCTLDRIQKIISAKQVAQEPIEMTSSKRAEELVQDKQVDEE